VLLEGPSLDHVDHGRRAPLHTGHEQRRLGKPVAGIERLATKAAGGEGGAEALQGLCLHRLRPADRDLPTAEVQPEPLLPRDGADAQLVAEVGRTARGSPVPCDRPEPAHRLLKECERRHQDARHAQIQRMQHAADQAHVVVQRHPADDDGVLRMAKGVAHETLVVKHVAMAHHHAPGARRGPGRVLEECQGVSGNGRLLPKPGLQRVRGHPPQRRAERQRHIVVGDV
jgi:hypothetical protein